jgi:hypothetical protein
MRGWQRSPSGNCEYAAAVGCTVCVVYSVPDVWQQQERMAAKAKWQL